MDTKTLRDLIALRGLTVTGAAQRIGISKVSLCSILRGGDCKVSTLRLIADALSVHPSVLLSR